MCSYIIEKESSLSRKYKITVPYVEVKEILESFAREKRKNIKENQECRKRINVKEFNEPNNSNPTSLAIKNKKR